MSETFITTRAPTQAPELVAVAVLEAAGVPGGIPRSVLWAVVADRMADLDPGAEAPSPDRVLRALGMCIVRGELDEVDGRIVPVAALGDRAASA